MLWFGLDAVLVDQLANQILALIDATRQQLFDRR